MGYLKKILINGVVVYPTETVFGLGCNPKSEKALRRINQIKGREGKGFIIVANKVSYLQEYADYDLSKLTLLNTNQRATTIVVPCKKSYQGLLTAGQKSIAIRFSDYPAIVKLCDTLGGAIVSTSLNVSGKPPITNLEEAKENYKNIADVLIEGKCGGQRPSQIIDVITNKIIRE